jgi:hypothetical protein
MYGRAPTPKRTAPEAVPRPCGCRLDLWRRATRASKSNGIGFARLCLPEGLYGAKIAPIQPEADIL